MVYSGKTYENGWLTWKNLWKYGEIWNIMIDHEIWDWLPDSTGIFYWNIVKQGPFWSILKVVSDHEISISIF